MATLSKRPGMPLLKWIFAIVPRICYFFFWILDTLIVLVKRKVLAKGDKKLLEWLTFRWGFLWTVANFFTWFYTIWNLCEIQSEELSILLKKKTLLQQGQLEEGEKNHD